MKITFLVLTVILVVQSAVAQFDAQYQAITSTLFGCGEGEGNGCWVNKRNAVARCPNNWYFGPQSFGHQCYCCHKNNE